MKIKRVLPLVLSLIMAGGAFAGLAGCNNGGGNNGGGEEPSVHTHDYDNWQSISDTQHTGTCKSTVGTCGAPTKTEDHKYDDDQDTTCNKCGHVRTLSGGEDTSTPLPADKKIYVVGDSTVCSFSDNYYLPRYGYGTQLHEYLNVEPAQINNLALSGRSSKSFLTEGNYNTLKTSIKTGDYLIIGFGHNDEKSDEPARFTDPNGTVSQETTAKGTSLKYCLNENYIKLANSKGATPILCTPIVRYDSSGSYTGAKVHNTADGDYSAAIRALGEETQTTVVDLTELTKTVYKADNAAAQYFHAHTSYTGDKPNETPSGIDGTHINKYGAKMVAYQFAQALKSTGCALKAQVKTNVAAPTKAACYDDAKKPDYVKPDYASFDPENTTATKLNNDGWYATAMGVLGGDSTSPFSSTYSGGTFTVGSNSATKGKINSAADGFGAAFVRVDASKNFTATATVKVKTNLCTNTEGGFGMMLRDDIYINTRNDTLNSNYVAAGVLTSGTAIFSRENSVLNSSGNTATYAVNDTYALEITRVGQTVTVKLGTYIKTYIDFDFVAVDNGYMYLCLFATRGITVEFTDVQFEITGDSQGA